jgi:soluble lytic murein transglycosylase
MRIESAFDPRAVSKMGAMGLMQVMPQWIDVLDIQCDLYDPECSVKYGLQILGAYEQMYGNLDMALTAYNRGPGPVDYALMKGQDPDNGYAAKIRTVYNRLRAISGAQSNLEVAYTK